MGVGIPKSQENIIHGSLTTMHSALLSERGLVSVTGKDALPLLQGLITNDLASVDEGACIYAGLLSPQGKILFDFFVWVTRDGCLLEVRADLLPDLVKRLTLYKLRSQVEIADASANLAVLVAWGDNVCIPNAHLTAEDPRLPGLGVRAIVPVDDVEADQSAREAYDAHRIALGVPEGGYDWAYADAFPHEALFDQLHGVSFAKGCFVGQEIVSRMEHRGTARKRIVKVSADGDLPPRGTPIVAGDVSVGTLGSSVGGDGLAIVRIDRVAEFQAKGVTLLANDLPVVLAKPEFAAFAFEAVG